MAGPGTITFEQYPTKAADKIPVITNWNPVIGYMVLNDDISDLFYFKLILEVYTGTAVVAANLIGKIKQRRNGYGSDITNERARAYFDLRDLVNSVLVPTIYDQNLTGQPFDSIHTIGSNADVTKIFSDNGDSKNKKTQISSIYVKAYQEYSENATDVPAEDDSETVNDTLYWLQASFPLFQTRNADAAFLQSSHFQAYIMNGSSGKFLSDVTISAADYNLGSVIRNYVQEKDFHTVAFINGVAEFGSDPYYIGISFYDSSNGAIASPGGTDIEYIINSSANGGWSPDTTVSKEDINRLLYFGCGPQNLEFQDANIEARPSEYTDWAYYTIQAYDSDAVTVKSAKYYFIRQDSSCKGFIVRRLGWINSKGGYDYFNFKMKSTRTIDVERNTYNTLIGRFDGSVYSYNDTQRGITTRKVTAILKETIQTDWITEEDATLLQNLIQSTGVYLIENTDVGKAKTEGVIVKDTSFVQKTVANDKMIQYTINIEYANPVNTNS